MSKDQKRYGHRQPEDRTEAEGRQLRWRSGVMVGLFAAALCVYCGVLYNIQSGPRERTIRQSRRPTPRCRQRRWTLSAEIFWTATAGCW